MIGASRLKIFSVDATEYSGMLAHRNNMSVFNIRAEGNLGIEQLFLASGYVCRRVVYSLGSISTLIKKPTIIPHPYLFPVDQAHR